jgi:hypothetical protein
MDKLKIVYDRLNEYFIKINESCSYANLDKYNDKGKLKKLLDEIKIEEYLKKIIHIFYIIYLKMKHFTIQNK